MLTLILKLCLSHLLGDFALQPTKWIERRPANPLKFKYLYYHIAVHLLLLLLFFFNQIAAVWLGILLITISHFLIDLTKIYCEQNTKINKFTIFITDQLLHFAVIAIVVNIYFPYSLKADMLFSNKALLILLTLLIISSVAPIFLRIFFSRWSKSMVSNEHTPEESLKTESLQGAGKYIGILERILIVVFINTGFPEGIGYLLAAKSIFRFGDLTNSKEKKLTEYILIGTFMSFAIAIVAGYLLKIFLTKI